MSDANHPWLRRVSDYHSGDVSETERIAVEAHLATCAICQSALTEYGRLYALARSPLQLGLPSQAVMRRSVMQTSTPGWGSPPPERNPESKQCFFIGLAASLAAVLVIGGFLAVFAIYSRTPPGASTPVASS